MKNLLFLIILLSLAVSIQAQKNPYDYIGKIHNEALDEILHSKSEWATSNENETLANLKSQVINQTYSEVKSTYKGKLDENGLKKSISSKIDELPNIQEFKSGDFDQIIKDASLGRTAENYLIQLLNLDGGFEDVLSQISEIEANILAKDFENKELCLMSTAVLKHSYQYWYEYSQNKGSKRSLANENELLYIKWGAIAKADATGAVVGGVRGAIAGVSSGALVMGPGGVVLTAAGGAVAGALWSSAGTAVLWSWW